MAVRGAPAIISSLQLSSWTSCQTITPMISQSYKILFGERPRFFNFATGMRASEILKLAREIRRSQPECLIFIDHVPHPMALLSALTSLGKLPPIYFHIYGDFTLYTPWWMQCKELLKNVPVTFITASPRQKILVSKFVKSPEECVFVCPFSIDTERFKFSVRGRAAARRKLGLKNDEFAILYSGRMTLQKNVHLLMQAFGQIAFDRKLKLFLAGSFDDIGAPFFNEPGKPGEYFYEIERQRWKLPPTANERVKYLGCLRDHALVDAYLACDVYASLSLHHDEDFGISPAEALSCGMPAVLTNWGGFTGFKEMSPQDVELVDVSIAGRGSMEIDIAKLNEFILRTRDRAESDETRAARSARFALPLSPRGAAEKLREIHALEQKRFAGFTTLLNSHAKLWYRQPIFANDKSNIYQRVYRSYTEQMNERGN